MSKLELKQINNYFAHRLEVISNERKPNERCLLVQINFGVDQDLVLLQGYNEEFDFFEDKIENIKPIIRPITDLIKSLEIYGQKIIPLVELAKLESISKNIIIDDLHCNSALNTLWVDYEENDEESFDLGSKYRFCFCIDSFQKGKLNPNQHSFVRFQLGLWEKLFEWHFDVFGLIEKGLAVDINTLSVE